MTVWRARAILARSSAMASRSRSARSAFQPLGRPPQLRRKLASPAQRPPGRPRRRARAEREDPRRRARSADEVARDHCGPADRKPGDGSTPWLVGRHGVRHYEDDDVWHHQVHAVNGAQGDDDRHSHHSRSGEQRRSPSYGDGKNQGREQQCSRDERLLPAGGGEFSLRGDQKKKRESRIEPARAEFAESGRPRHEGPSGRSGCVR